MPHKNPEDRRASRARWRDQNRDAIVLHNRRAQLKRKYGITIEEYDAMLLTQGGRCAICSTTDPGGASTRGNFHVDHDHATGRVRGLLCFKCNTTLAVWGDDEAGILRVLAYLRQASAPEPHTSEG